MNYTITDLEEHLTALQNTFGLIGESIGFSEPELMSLRNRVVEERGKYDVNWQNDPEEKLAFDFYYCVEMSSVLEEEGDLSPKRRLRLYRMATMNPSVKKIWDLDPYWDPIAFLDQDQIKEKIWKQKYRRKTA